MAAASDPFRLVASPLEAELVPAIGGSLASLRHDGVDVLRPLSDEDRAAANVLGVAMFPMVPYANRIRGNAFEFGGRVHRFAANNPPEPFNVHGTGWRRPWRASGVTAEAADLALAVEGDGEPYRYRATQAFRLDSEGLTVLLAIVNTGDTAMPFGLGLHPWLPRDPDAVLRFRAKRFYLEEPGHVAGDAVTMPPELDFAQGRPLPTSWRNNDHGGWDGRATVTFPSRGLVLTIEAEPVFRHLMLYADPTKPYFCVEPQTNASGAFNRPDGFTDPAEGVLVLGPGEGAQGMVRFEVSALG